MQIAAQKVVSIEYTLKNASGEVLDSSVGHGPLAYIHGNGNIVPGLEKALEGKRAGDKVSVSVPPEQGYGVRDESLVQQVPRRAFGGVKDLQPGMQFQAGGPSGPSVVSVVRVQGDMVTVDGNHALAGETLNFEVEVKDVRDATHEEVMHGHVHGPGGHEH
ncbi:MAG TPA: peptidylprolyl isomerase [Candidatus Binatia bacterium]|nr:peptidylprolyl isomerase [Candidatus Binatia bacterium]